VNPLPAKTAEVQVAVVGDQPEDVGLVLGKGNRGKKKNRQEHDYAFHGREEFDAGDRKGQATLRFIQFRPNPRLNFTRGGVNYAWFRQTIVGHFAGPPIESLLTDWNS
jgi:hypothetical protein